jgi:hypothetical protein
MPSYYDSTKKKPGKAKLKYAKGGKVKKMAHGGIVEPKTVSAGFKNGHDETFARGSGAARPQIFRKNG